MPFLVHGAEDSANEISIAAPTTTWGECADFLNEAIVKYGAHLLAVASVHLAQDLDNYFSFGTLAAPDTALIMSYSNNLKEGLNAHMEDWPGVHQKWDTQNAVSSPDAGDLATTITLLTEFRSVFNAHVALMGYGDTNSDAAFEFAGGVLGAGGFLPDLSVEGFEQRWDLAAMYATAEEQSTVVTMPGPGTVQVEIGSIPNNGDYFTITDDVGTTVTFEYDDDDVWTTGRVRIDLDDPEGPVTTIAEAREVTVAAILGTSLAITVSEPTDEIFTFVLNSGGRVDSTTLDEGTTSDHFTVTLFVQPSWPVGHMEFLDRFEYIQSEFGGRDHFQEDWLLPGANAAYPNQAFTGVYYADEEWHFPVGLTELGITETFESGWRDNDAALAAYWSGTEWRFDSSARPTQYELGGFGSYYTYMTIDLDGFTETIEAALTGAPAVYSPNLRLRAPTAFTAPIAYPELTVTVQSPASGTPNVAFAIPTTMTAGQTLSLDLNAVAFGLYEILALNTSGTIPDVVGTIVFEGLETYREAFETDWTLSLDD